MEYQDKISTSIDFIFPIDNKNISEIFSCSSTNNSYVASWTTTPWTLPANLAVSVNEHLDYVFAKDNKTVGIGAGQMNRVNSVQLATIKASEHYGTTGSVLASDAFFPFRDGIDEAAKAGVKAIVQPGGSIRDDEVIEACDEHGISMIFVGVRHFKH